MIVTRDKDRFRNSEKDSNSTWPINDRLPEGKFRSKSGSTPRSDSGSIRLNSFMYSARQLYVYKVIQFVLETTLLNLQIK